MPPRTTLTSQSASLTSKSDALRATLTGVAGALLGPGTYELRNVLLPGSLPTWPGNPISGHIHVAMSGSDLVETWILFPSYKPVNLSPQDGVVIKAVSTQAPPPFNTFLGSVNPGAGTVITTWSYAAPSGMTNVAHQLEVGGALKRLAPPSRKVWEQCMPGEVEIVATSPTGALGPTLGTVSVTGQTGGPWQSGQVVEDWTIFTGTTSLPAGQAALLRPSAGLLAAPQGSTRRLWNVSYQQL